MSVCYSCRHVRVVNEGMWCFDCVEHSRELESLIARTRFHPKHWDEQKDTILHPFLTLLKYADITFEKRQEFDGNEMAAFLVIKGKRPDGKEFLHVCR